MFLHSEWWELKWFLTSFELWEMFGLSSQLKFLLLAVVLVWPPQCSNWYLARISSVYRFWISISLSPPSLFVHPALWFSVLQILIASALCNHDLCLLNLEKTNKLFSFLSSALPSGNAVQKKSWGDHRPRLTYFPFFRGHSPALLLPNILKHIFNVFPPRFVKIV